MKNLFNHIDLWPETKLLKEIYPWKTRNNFVSDVLSKVKLLLNILVMEITRKFSLKG